MGVRAQVGWGTKLEVDLEGGTTYAEIGLVRTISIDGPEQELADATHAQSTNALEETLAGMIEPEELTIEVLLDPDDSELHASLEAEVTRRPVLGSDEDLPAFRITYPDKVAGGVTYTTTETFDAYVTSFAWGAPIDDALTATITLKVEGKPTRTTTDDQE